MTQNTLGILETEQIIKIINKYPWASLICMKEGQNDNHWNSLVKKNKDSVCVILQIT